MTINATEPCPARGLGLSLGLSLGLGLCLGLDLFLGLRKEDRKSTRLNSSH